MRTEAYFSVVGVEPAPQGSKKPIGNNRFIEASKKLEPWREAIGEAIERMFVATVDRSCFAPDTPLEVWVTFVVPRPATVKEAARPWPIKPPDTDKYCRSLGDGMSLARYVDPPLIPDDSQIVRWHAEKVYGTRGDMGARVAVKVVTEP